MAWDYTVEIMGQDYDPEYGWADEHYPVAGFPCDSYEDAVAFCDGITTEQALEWEREADCNGLDVVIFADEVLEDGTYGFGFRIVGEYAWVGSERMEG